MICVYHRSLLFDYAALSSFEIMRIACFFAAHSRSRSNPHLKSFTEPFRSSITGGSSSSAPHGTRDVVELFICPLFFLEASIIIDFSRRFANFSRSMSIGDFSRKFLLIDSIALLEASFDWAPSLFGRVGAWNNAGGEVGGDVLTSLDKVLFGLP